MKKTMMNEPILSRRDVLRGTLAVGLGLLFPLATVSSAAVAAEAPAKKVSKKSVQYTDHATGEKKCGSCVYFTAQSNTCKRVSGKVNAAGVCILWTKQG